MTTTTRKVARDIATPTEVRKRSERTLEQVVVLLAKVGR